MVYWQKCYIDVKNTSLQFMSPEYILLGSSNCWCGVAWNPVEQEGGEALLQQNRCSRQQVTYCLPLPLAGVPGQS